MYIENNEMNKLINEIETFLNQECLEEEDFVTELYYVLNELRRFYDSK